MPVRRNLRRSAETPPVLEVDGLRKSYRLGREALSVLRGLSLSVDPGEMLVIMGPSGSGKTTLLNCVAGIEVPDTGFVQIGGDPLDRGSEHARTRLRRERVGMVFQFFNLIPTLTVRENVALPFLIDGGQGPEADCRVDRLLRDVGMQERRDHYPFELSGGEMQLTSIARALARRPQLLLADEPTGNVNPRVGASIMEILRDASARERAGVLMVTHSPEHAAWGDRICFLRDGAVVSQLDQGGRSDQVAAIHERLVELGI